MSLLNRRRALLSLNKGLLPQQYQQVEYLECSGTQWIDTGFYLKSEDDIEFKVSSENFLTNGKSASIFSSNNIPVNPFWHYSCNFGSTVADRTLYTWKYYATTYGHINRIYGFVDGVKKTIKTIGKYWYVDGNGVESNGLNPWVSGEIAPNSLHLFCGIASADASVTPHQATPLRMHYFKVINDNEIIAEFIPCYRKADGKTGMYDIVNNKFCPNNGTGEFILGGEV